MRIHFEDQGSKDFYQILRKRVDNYFVQKGLTKQGGWTLYAKSLAILAIQVGLYFLLYAPWLNGTGVIAVFALFGAATGFLHFMIVHDALHGAFSTKPWLNRLAGYLFDLNGTSSYVWKITHNNIHHTYTNIPGYDGDIDKAIMLRLNPQDKLYPFHAFQHIYAFFLYGLVSINWILYVDYVLFFNSMRQGGVPTGEKVLFFGFKALNLTLTLVLPLLFIQQPVWLILLGHVCGHLSAGLTISLIFQLAHVVENVGYASPDASGTIKNNWAAHEMATTSNFATDNLFLTYILGGLNYQVEHHLFPTISHTHYPSIQPIVKATAAEYGIPYLENHSLCEAVASHYRRMKALGRSP